MYEDWDACMRMVTHIQGLGSMYTLGHACTKAMTHLGIPRWFMLAYVQAGCVNCGAIGTCHACNIVPACEHAICSHHVAMGMHHVCLSCGHFGRAQDVGMDGGGSMHG